MIYYLPYKVVNLTIDRSMETNFSAADDAAALFFAEVDVKYPVTSNQKTKCFPCCPEKK